MYYVIMTGVGFLLAALFNLALCLAYDFLRHRNGVIKGPLPYAWFFLPLLMLGGILITVPLIFNQ